jgi:hypothetical protein
LHPPLEEEFGFPGKVLQGAYVSVYVTPRGATAIDLDMLEKPSAVEPPLGFTDWSSFPTLFFRKHGGGFV